MGGEGFLIPVGGRRELPLVSEDHPDIAQDPFAEGPLVRGRTGVAGVRLVEETEAAGCFPQ
jgi:hypothetical protein